MLIVNSNLPACPNKQWAGIFFYTIILSGIILLTVCVKPVLAVTTPTFPSCCFPQGTLKVYHQNGIHGIPGDTNEHQGSDSVYILSETALLQCFSIQEDQGIQTNWWKIPDLAQKDIDFLKRLDWIYIPNGSLWGLDNAPYMTLSFDYFCQGGVGGGEVLGTSTLGSSTLGSILGLATTGNILSIYSLLSLGSVSLILSLLLRKKKKTIRK